MVHDVQVCGSAVACLPFKTVKIKRTRRGRGEAMKNEIERENKRVVQVK